LAAIGARRPLALALFATAAWAVDWKALQPQGYVSDFAGVIDAGSRAELERYCAAVERATGAQFAFVVVRSLEGEPVEDVANILYRAWGVGQKGKNEGLLLLLSIADRRSRLEVGYGLEPIITDGQAGSILREMRPALRQQNYGEALLAAAQTLGTRVAQAKGAQIGEAPPRRRIPSEPSDAIPWPLVLGGVVVLLLLFGNRGGGRRGGGTGAFLPGWILGDLMSRSWTSGRGGFGGYDSGDSFGGFGGGDSGGGGASSNW
jgi:uncharacterized protein